MRDKIPVILLFAMVAACNPSPEKIRYGKDQCAYCRMSIADPKFGGELVTARGRIYKFDATECMIPFQQENDQEFIYKLVTPYDRPGELVRTDSVVFVISDTIKSPMGANLAALTKLIPDTAGTGGAGRILSWDELKEVIRR